MTKQGQIAAADIVSDSVREHLEWKVGAKLGLHNGFAPSGASVERVELSIPPLDPFCWLRSQDSATRIYWSPRDGDLQVAAVGMADRCSCPPPGDPDRLRRHLAPILSSADPGIRYYGGLRFDQMMHREDRWAPFGAYSFVLPRFELRTDSDGTRIACNLFLPRDREELTEVFRQIRELDFGHAAAAGHVPTPVSRRVRPDRGTWRDMVQWALNAFKRSNFDKVVFARVTEFGFDEEPNAIDLLERLRSVTPNCFHFCFQHSGAPAFVGASPERLFRRRGLRIESEAVAGTRPRGRSQAHDARLLRELLQSEKERWEHEYVRISLREEMGPLAEHLELDAEPSELRLATKRHLISRMHATLRPGVTTLDVLAALHPTPAVGGYGLKEAMGAIREHEPFDRGWYAGPIGWIGSGAAEFAVGIRSGLVAMNRLFLYAGAGIVEGSTPDAEWDELEQKIVDFTGVLGLNGQL